MPERPVLVTGATGHVGSELVDELLRRGKRVRAMSRSPLDRDGVETVEADVLDRESLDAALDGVGGAYYLVHALASDDGFGEEERNGAENFAAAAEAAGVGRIVYLGGIANGDDLSEHLRTRQEVGEILRDSSVLAIELQASVVIGEGSASFELVRTLVDYLPVLVLPDWIESPCQPIALEDVVAYLVEALDVDVPGSAVFEVGGADRITYRELLDLYGKAVGSNRPTIAAGLADPALGLADEPRSRARPGCREARGQPPLRLVRPRRGRSAGLFGAAGRGARGDRARRFALTKCPASVFRQCGVSLRLAPRSSSCSASLPRPVPSPTAPSPST